MFLHESFLIAAFYLVFVLDISILAIGGLIILVTRPKFAILAVFDIFRAACFDISN